MYSYLGSQEWISAYETFLLLALAACWWLARSQARVAGVNPSHVDALMPLSLITGLALVVLLPGYDVRLFPLILGGAVALLAYSHATGLSLPTLADVLAMPTVVAVVVERVGCFLAGCCWGDVAIEDGWLDVIANTNVGRQLQTLHWVTGEWVITAVTYPAGSLPYQQHLDAGLITADALRSLPVHPTQLYEAALLLLVAVLLGRRRYPRGSVAIASIAAYSLIRLGLGFLRADSRLIVGDLSLAQLLSAALLVAAIGLHRLHTGPACN